MASVAVMLPAGTVSPRPTEEMPTTRSTPCSANARSPARAKPEYASSTLGAVGSAGTSQKTARAPANALSTTAASECEPWTTSACSRTRSGSREGSRAITRTASPGVPPGSPSRWSRSWRPMELVGAVTTIMEISTGCVT
jgi:hypothetical protein